MMIAQEEKVRQMYRKAVNTIKFGKPRVLSLKALAKPYGLIAPGTNVYFRTTVESYFTTSKSVDFVWLVGDYDPATETFTYYPPILYMLDVPIPAETSAYFDTPAFALPNWGAGSRDVLVMACEDFNPETLTCSGMYDQFIKEDVFVIETLGIADVALLTV